MSMPPIAKTKIGEVEKAGTLQSMIEDLGKIPLEFSPGEAWNYSVATDVVGYLVGQISGKPFEQFLKERILDPLGMNDTDFFVPADKAHRFAACYSADPQGGMTFHAAEQQGRPDAAGRPGHEFVPVAAVVHFRRRRTVLDRMPIISPSAARCSIAANSAASG